MPPLAGDEHPLLREVFDAQEFGQIGQNPGIAGLDEPIIIDGADVSLDLVVFAFQDGQ